MANIVGRNRLVNTKAPALPFLPVQYDRQVMDSVLNILRQYFLTIDNVNNSLIETGGGYYLSFPHIAASNGSDQFATGDNVAKLVAWDAADSLLGFELNTAVGPLQGSATASKSGIYKIDYSLQFVNTDNTDQHDVYVWLKLASAGTTTFVNVPKSASKFTVPKAKNSSFHGYTIAYSSVVFTMNAGDSVQLFWSTNKAALTALGSGVYMEAYPVQTIGSDSLPSTPSAIGSIVFVSGLTE